MMNKKRSSILGIIVFVLIAGGLVFYGYMRNPSHTGYQAVFLSNNQVYFGKVSHQNDTYVTLNDIYYIQVSQPLQSQTPVQAPQANLNLVKLGSELHGPADMMQINRDHILFIEDLKDDSQVVQAIKSYQSSKH